MEVVKGIVKEMGGGEAAGMVKLDDKIAAETAAEVADVAATMDKSKGNTPLPS